MFMPRVVVKNPLLPSSMIKAMLAKKGGEIIGSKATKLKNLRPKTRALSIAYAKMNPKRDAVDVDNIAITKVLRNTVLNRGWVKALIQ